MIEDKLIRHIEGTIASPASVQNKQWKLDVGDNGTGGDESELICQDSSGTQHIFETREQSRDWVNQQINISNASLNSSEGTYTPVASNLTNISSATPTVFEWFRIGDHVTIYGELSISIVASSFSTGLELSLPITSAFSETRNASGLLIERDFGALPVYSDIYAETTNNTLYFRFVSEVIGIKNFNFKCTYKVI